MPSLNQKEKITCEIWGTRTTRNNFVRHKNRYSAGSLTCLFCTNFSTKSRAEMNYHSAKKHSKAPARVVLKCEMCDKDFQSFYFLREHKRKEYGSKGEFKSSKCWCCTSNGKCWWQKLVKEVETCKYTLVNSEMENGRHRVYNFAMGFLNPN